MRLSALLFLSILLSLPISGWSQDYQIGPEDVLQIQVWSRPDLSGQVTVESSGEIRLALLGSVPAEGRGPEELGAELARRYAILDARISEVLVSVVAYRSRAVTVVGEVKNPGTVSFQTIPNLWEVLLAAGGATPQADLSTVQIVRKTKVEGEPHTVTADLSRGIEKADLEALPEVRPRDTVVVPSLVGDRAAGESFQVLGAVARPGVYHLSTTSTVIGALAACGGPLDYADLSQVHLSRPGAHGAAAFQLDVDGHLKRGVPFVDFPLKQGDTITVPGRTGLSVGEVMTRVIGLASFITAVTSIILLLE